jgi:hypothetical protein
MHTLKSIILFFSAFLLITTNLKAQTADEILEKHIAAIGGRDSWNKVHSIAMAGTLAAGDQVAEFSTTVVDGKGFRQDFTISGVTGYKIITPTDGWMFIPGAGDEKVNHLSKEELNDAQGQLYVKGNLIDYKGRGAKVKYLGKERTEGQDCYKLKLAEKNGKEEYLYINTENYYLISSLTRAKMLDKEMDIATVYKEYEKQPEGIVIATGISTQGSNIHFATIAINKPVDENIFKPVKR